MKAAWAMESCPEIRMVRKLHAEGAVSVMRDTSPEMEEIRELLRDSQRGSRDKAIRARYHGTGEDKLAVERRA